MLKSSVQYIGEKSAMLYANLNRNVWLGNVKCDFSQSDDEK